LTTARRAFRSEADIPPYLDKRRPGQSRFTTQRQELNAVKNARCFSAVQNVEDGL